MQTTILRAAIIVATCIATACSDGATDPESGLTGRIAPDVAFDHDAVAEPHGVRIVRETGEIAAAVGEYRDLLGDLNPNVKDEQPGGRREINWDAVPAGVTNTDNFPANFFNVNSPRGVVFSTDGTGFRISDNGYADVNAHYAGEFNAFSPTKLFVARGSTIIDVSFFVAGSQTPATVTGFGSVFEDVNRGSSTTIEYFDVNGHRLLKLAVPKKTDERGLSFAGAVFASRIVAKVRITAGNTPIGPDAFDGAKVGGKKVDLVVTDDFIYGEPRAIK
jgi:hypothetical protein